MMNYNLLLMIITVLLVSILFGCNDVTIGSDSSTENSSAINVSVESVDDVDQDNKAQKIVDKTKSEESLVQSEIVNVKSETSLIQSEIVDAKSQTNSMQSEIVDTRSEISSTSSETEVIQSEHSSKENGNSEEQSNVMNLGKLYVNNNCIEGVDIDVNSDCAKVPFLKIIRCLNLSVEEKTTNKYEIKNRNAVYFLNCNDKISLVRKGDTENLLIPPPGCFLYHCEYKDNEVVVDSVTLKGALQRMGVLVEVLIDQDTCSVYVNKR